MALYITFENDEHESFGELYTVAHFNNGLEWDNHPAMDEKLQLKVKLVQADGHELEYIKQNFSGITINNTQRINTWVGEMARNIVLNLPLEWTSSDE